LTKRGSCPDKNRLYYVVDEYAYILTMDWYKIASQEYNDYLHVSNDAAISMVQDKLDKKFVEIVNIALKRERQYTAIRAQYDMGGTREEYVETTRIAVNRRQYDELRIAYCILRIAYCVFLVFGTFMRTRTRG
jgi:hypothetical protein